MPLYEYICEKCNWRVEVIQKVSDAPLKRCSKCRGKLEKAVSRTSFKLKGSGWYATDYSGKKAPATKDKTEKTDDKKRDDKKSDDKKSESAPATPAAGDGD